MQLAIFDQQKKIPHYMVDRELKKTLNQRWQEQEIENAIISYWTEQNAIKEKNKKEQSKFFKNFKSEDMEILTSPLTRTVKMIAKREMSGDSFKKNIYQLTIMKHDVKLNVSNVFGEMRKPKPKTPTKTKISKFSYKSRMNLKENCDNISHSFSKMITLTYPEDIKIDGKKAKRDLRAFLDRLRKLKMKYFWILEFMKNGQPHFHILVDKYWYYKKVSKAWQDITGIESEASTRIEQIRKRDNGISYMASYMGKEYQKQTPDNFKDVGRFWGMSRGVVKKEIITTELTQEEAVKTFEPIFKRYEEIRNTAREKTLRASFAEHENKEDIEACIKEMKLNIVFKNQSFKFKNFRHYFKNKVNTKEWKKTTREKIGSKIIIDTFLNVLKDKRNKYRIQKTIDKIELEIKTGDLVLK